MEINDFNISSFHIDIENFGIDNDYLKEAQKIDPGPCDSDDIASGYLRTVEYTFLSLATFCVIFARIRFEYKAISFSFKLVYDFPIKFRNSLSSSLDCKSSIKCK